MSGYEDSFVPLTAPVNTQNYEDSFVPLAQQPVPQNQPPEVVDLTDPSNILQRESGYILNAANGVPGVNLIKEGGAALRGLYAGATAPSDQSFGDAYSNEYDNSRNNQNALINQFATDYPSQNAVGKISAALITAGLPMPKASGSMLTDALMGGGATGGYGLASGFGVGQSFDDRLKNSVNNGITGLAIGAPLSAVGGGISKAVTGLKNYINPADLPAVNSAIDQNIPIFRNNVSDSKGLDYVSTLSNEIPSILGGTSGRVPQQQEAVASALTAPIGGTSGVLNEDEVSKALKSSGLQIGDIIGRNDLPVSNDVLNNLDNVSAEAASKLTGDKLDAFNKQVQSLKDLVVNKTSGQASSGQGIIPGARYQSERQLMNNTIVNNSAGPSSDLGHFTKQLRNTMDDAFQGAMTPADSLALQKARGIYSNASDLSGVTDKNPTGDYSFGSLYGKLADNPNFEPTALAAQLLKNQTGNSGTAQRQFIIDTAKGLGSAGAGALGLYEEKKFTGDENPLADTLMDVGGAGLGAAGLGMANRAVNPRITEQNLNGYSAIQPYSSQALNIARFLMNAGNPANQIYNSGGK